MARPKAPKLYEYKVYHAGVTPTMEAKVFAENDETARKIACQLWRLPPKTWGQVWDQLVPVRMGRAPFDRR